VTTPVRSAGPALGAGDVRTAERADDIRTHIITKDFITMPLSRIPLSVFTLALAASIGCGKSDGPRVTTHPASGKISINGEAPVGATISFHSPQAADPKSAPKAIVEKDGTFKVTTYQKSDGAPPGDYTATVAWYKITPEGVRGDDVVPKQYSNSATSPIKVSIKPGSNEIPPIEIR
jgi:hypothetical protein